MTSSFLDHVAYAGVVSILSHVPWLGHEGLSASFLSETSREGELDARETSEHGGCNTSMPVALASDLCLFYVPHPHSCPLQKGCGGSWLISESWLPFTASDFILSLVYFLLRPSQRSGREGGGWKNKSIYCDATALSDVGWQIQQIRVVF